MRLPSCSLADIRPHPTLLSALAARGDTAGCGLTCIDHDGTESALSWASVVLSARRRATWLAARCAAAPGTPIGIAIPNDMRGVEALLACWLLELVPVPLAPPGLAGPAALERAGHIVSDAGVALLLCAPSDAADFSGLGVSVVPIAPMPPGLAARDIPSVDPGAAALLQYTSGTTARPRGVVLTHGNLAANCHLATSEHAFQPGEAMISWLPLYHDMGLIAELLVALLRGVPLYLMEPLTFLHDPLLWLRAIATHRCTITHVPNFALAHCVRRARGLPPGALDLRSLSAVFVGSEPIDLVQIEAFAERFSEFGLDPGSLGGAYGLAESTVAVSRTVPRRGVQVDMVDRAALAAGRAVPVASGGQRLASVGAPIPGHTVSIQREGAACAEREVGELWVSGPSVMRGYWRAPEASAAALRADEDGTRWLRTGDLGYRVGESLFICGRQKDLLVQRGKNYAPQDIERAAEQVPGVRGGRAVAFSTPSAGGAERIVVVCESSASAGERAALSGRIRGAVLEAVGLKVDEVAIRPPDTLPRTTSGKRQRRRVRAAWLSSVGA